MSVGETLAQRAGQVLPGGVCSSARQNKMLGRAVYMDRGAGSRLWDVDGNEYIDLCTGFGATVIGHGHPKVVEAIRKAADLGLMCAMENPYQAEMAERLAAAVPSIDMLRFTLSGTETTLYAVKVAKAYTGRSKIVKFEGHFHGFNDYLAYNYWPPLDQAWPARVPAAAGLPALRTAAGAVGLAGCACAGDATVGRERVPAMRGDVGAARGTLARHRLEDRQGD